MAVTVVRDRMPWTRNVAVVGRSSGSGRGDTSGRTCSGPSAGTGTCGASGGAPSPGSTTIVPRYMFMAQAKG